MSYGNHGIFPSPKVQISPYGTLLMTLKDHVIEITLDGGIFIMNSGYSITVTISACGNFTVIDHPMGRVFGHSSKVEIQAPNFKGTRFAKMWKKGVSFTTEYRGATFLLDAGGTKTTVDWFMAVDENSILQAFYYNSRYGHAYIPSLVSFIKESEYWITSFGQENWKFNNVRICQYMDGHIKVFKDSKLFTVSIQPVQGSVCVSTPTFYSTASLGPNSHLYVKSGDRRLHYDGKILSVRNGGQIVTVDEINQLKLT